MEQKVGATCTYGAFYFPSNTSTELLEIRETPKQFFQQVGYI